MYLPVILINEKATAEKASLEKSVAEKGGRFPENGTTFFRKITKFTSKYQVLKRWQDPIQESTYLLAPARVMEDLRSETVCFAGMFAVLGS